jgi:hypothetical protein
MTTRSTTAQQARHARQNVMRAMLSEHLNRNKQNTINHFNQIN